MRTFLTRARWVPIVLLVLAGQVTACGPGTPDISPLSTPTGGVSPVTSVLQTPTSQVVPPLDAQTPTIDAGRLLHDITTNPDLYVGKQVIVEGVLESRGQMPNPRFFLRDEAGDLLEVAPWAPLEVIQSPLGKTGPKAMSYYTGKQLRLTGTIEKGPEGAILQVSAVEER
jgi:hypothetical protein